MKELQPHSLFPFEGGPSSDYAQQDPIFSATLVNAFSLRMLADIPPRGVNLKVRPVPQSELQALLAAGWPLKHAVGHDSTAAVLSELLNSPITKQRETLQLVPGDAVIVATLAG